MENQFSKLDRSSGHPCEHSRSPCLKRFSEQVYEDQTSFHRGHGVSIEGEPQTQAVDITYIDMDQNIEALEKISERIAGRLSRKSFCRIWMSWRGFGNLEGFFQSHLKLISHDGTELRLPERQRAWFRKAQNLRSFLRSRFIGMVFQPENLFSHLDLLYATPPRSSGLWFRS